MTRAKISEYSATANDNTDVNGVDIAEGCPPSSMNNMGREIMAALKRFQVGSDGDGVTVGGSLVVAGDITVNSQGDLRFADSDSSNYVALQAPATVASNVTFTLPAADGTSGQVIQTNGSGALSFATASSLTGTTDSATPFETSVGSGAGAVNTGVNNTFVGFEAGNDNTTGTNNTAVGYQALDANTTGTLNVAIGANSLGANTTGSQNVAVGRAAATVLTTGTQNTCIGDLAGVALTTGIQNVFIGADAGSTSTTGTANVMIGRDARNASAGNSGELVINMSGSALAGKGANTGFIYPGNAGGMFQGNNNSAWSTTSDQRIKKNIVDNNEGLEIISQLRVRNFEYRLPEEITDFDPAQAIKKKGVQLGIIAQELQQVCPDCVTEQSTGILSVDTDEIFWHMVNAIKELSAQVTALQAEVNALKGQ